MSYKCPNCKQQKYIYNPEVDLLWHKKMEWPTYKDKIWYCEECKFVPFYLGNS